MRKTKITVCSLRARFHNSSLWRSLNSSPKRWIPQDEQHCPPARSPSRWQRTRRPHLLLLVEHSLPKSGGSRFPEPAPQTGYSFSTEQTFRASERPSRIRNVPLKTAESAAPRLIVWKEPCSQNISTAAVLRTSGHLPYVRGG